MVPESYYVALSAVLFSMGVLGVLVRRNPLGRRSMTCLGDTDAIDRLLAAVREAGQFAGLEVSSVSLPAASAEGQVLVFFVMCVAAAEVAVGLAIIVVIFRLRRRLSVDELSLMRW